MNIPGFTAEVSLLGKRENYATGVTVFGSAPMAVVPQAKALAKCQARCLGGYIGSAAGCFGSGNSDLCVSLAGQRYGRCNDFCDLLYG